MTGGGPVRTWMAVALGSAFVLGLSVGVVADRLFERDEVGAEPARTSESERSTGRAMFHFDCRAWQEEQAALTGRVLDEEPAPEAARARQHDENGVELTHRMARKLDLDAEQTVALATVVAEAMDRGRRYWSAARDDFCSMQRDFHDSVRSLLRSEQEPHFDHLERELERRYGSRDRGRTGEWDRERDAPEDCR